MYSTPSNFLASPSTSSRHNAIATMVMGLNAKPRTPRRSTTPILHPEGALIVRESPVQCKTPAKKTPKKCKTATPATPSPRVTEIAITPPTPPTPLYPILINNERPSKSTVALRKLEKMPVLNIVTVRETRIFKKNPERMSHEEGWVGTERGKVAFKACNQCFKGCNPFTLCCIVEGISTYLNSPGTIANLLLQVCSRDRALIVTTVETPADAVSIKTTRRPRHTSSQNTPTHQSFPAWRQQTIPAALSSRADSLLSAHLPELFSSVCLVLRKLRPVLHVAVEARGQNGSHLPRHLWSDSEVRILVGEHTQKP